ncbi:hypothetical protein V8D89_010100 [Ganoderma adspersum]
MSNFRPSFSLEELLDEPFGPFREIDALSPRVPSTTLKNPLVLKCVSLEAGPGVITGLDECEQCQPGYDKERFKHGLQVLFTGILDIDSPTWLTRRAIDIIDDALRERDYNARLATDPQAQRGSNLSLHSLYKALGRSSKKVQVIIQAIKYQTALFMQSKTVPNGLQLASSLSYESNPERSVPRKQLRRYKVASLHIATYERSRCVCPQLVTYTPSLNIVQYFRRWRLFWELQELLALDAGPAKSFRDNKTPLAERTPEWFVELYMRHKASNEQRQYRIHYDSDTNSDIEPGTGGSLKPGHHRAPHNVSRAEIRFRLERDGEWIRGQATMNQQCKWLDADVWTSWLAELDSHRRIHRRRGQFDLSETDYAYLDGDAKVGGLPRNPSQSASRPKAIKKRALKRIIISRPSSPAATSDDGLDVDPTTMRTYDPDFSPPSTTLGSPVSSASRPNTPVDPDLLALLPAELWQPPNVSALLRWTCPWNGCSHMIDLLHPTDEDMDHPAISEEDKQRFRNQEASWDGGDVWVRDVFAYMADKHHFWHLDQARIDVETIGGRYSFRWRHPSSYPRSPELRRVKIDDRQPRAETIKQEDM